MVIHVGAIVWTLVGHVVYSGLVCSRTNAYKTTNKKKTFKFRLQTAVGSSWNQTMVLPWHLSQWLFFLSDRELKTVILWLGSVYHFIAGSI